MLHEAHCLFYACTINCFVLNFATCAFLSKGKW